MSDWPRLDAQGRLRFAAPPIMLGAERRALEEFVDRYRETSRAVRVGDVFALRVRPGRLDVAEEVEERLEPVLPPEDWIEPPVYDVTPDAREAAKASFYAAVTPSLVPAEVALIEDIIERPPPAPPSPPVTPPPHGGRFGTPGRGALRLLQVVAGGVLLAGGVGAGVAIAHGGNGGETVTKPGKRSTVKVKETVPSIVDHTVTVRVTVSNGSTTSVTVQPTLVQVPDVVGDPQSEAESTLRNAKLDVSFTTVPSDQPKGIVTKQDPQAGVKVDQGTPVQVSVSSGQAVVTVPDEVGNAFKVANAELRRAGFAVDPHDVESGEEAGTVVDQAPEGGTAAPEGSTVTVSVSQGPAKTVTVPDVKGLDKAAAIAQIVGAGLGYEPTGQATTKSDEGGIVLDQTPTAGTEVDPGSIVTIIVGVYNSID